MPPSQSILDRNFPYAGGTDEDIVPAVGKNIPGQHRQTHVVDKGPEGNMGIKKNAHLLSLRHQTSPR
jgi:hypothetical protein